MSSQKVIIIGAGLAGSLLSTYFAKRGIETDVYEARSDMRLEEMSAGRSINLALSDRGIRALSEVGMDGYMLREVVPMHGRLIHSLDGSRKMLPYSGRKGEYINSVSRSGLNIALINEADNYQESTFHFNQRCVGFDCETGEALIENKTTGKRYPLKGETLIATDGAGSAVRRGMLGSRSIERFNFQQEFLDHGYKELSIPPISTGSGSDLLNDVEHTLAGTPSKTGGSSLFRMENNALHIWARNQFMMIALPNFDGSFTCTLFLAHEGVDSFEAIESGRWGTEISTLSDSELRNQQTIPNKSEPSNVLATARYTDAAKQSLMKFFEANFPNAISLMPDMVEEFFANPTGSLGTIKCFPWNVGGKALLLGDSAHAVVPFYGQGMNCAFEDCRVLNELIDKNGTDWATVFDEYGELRKANTDAIADMAVENFYEMRDAVTDPVFVRKRELEMKLEQTYPDYFSKYSLVTFREDIPYLEAMRRGNAQNELLMDICNQPEIETNRNLDEIMKALKSI